MRRTPLARCRGGSRLKPLPRQELRLGLGLAVGTSARVGELLDGGQPLPVEPPLSRRLCGRFVLVDHLDVALAQQPLHGDAPCQPQDADANAHLGGPADGSELHGYAQLFPLILVVSERGENHNTIRMLRQYVIILPKKKEPRQAPSLLEPSRATD